MDCQRQIAYDGYYLDCEGHNVANSEGSDDQTPEEVTMKDLWRLMSGFKGELQGVETRLEAKINGVETRLGTKIDTVKDELQGETQAIRAVVDTLASQDDFDSLDRKISAVSADTQATRQAVHDVKADVSRLRADVKKAGISVR